MDILKPELVWVDGRCYRVNPVKGKLSETANEPITEEDVPSGSFDCSLDDEPCDADIKESDGEFKVNMPVPSDFFSYIIGKKGATKLRIENETKTRISIPRMGNKGDIIVTGSQKGAVISAKLRIELLMNTIRQRTSNTHFVSVPFNLEPIISGFLDFKDDVLRYFGDCRGIDESIFQKPNKLHLTLGTLVLMDDNERNRAVSILQECGTEFIDTVLANEPIEVHVEGNEYMNDDPAEVDVLYAKIKNNRGFDRLMHITDLLVKKFVESGLMQQEYERVKLHMTIMNTLFRKKILDPSVSHDRKDRVTRETFDATQIMKKLSDHNFGKLKIATIEVSQLYSSTSESYYGCTASIRLPS